MSAPLLEVREDGLYCAAGDFHIDPWRPTARALVTHAHADHGLRGSDSYLVAQEGERVFRRRLGEDANIQTVDYGRPLRIGDVEVSFHPAGHILGSAQIRLACRGEVWVVSGDYKTTPDPTCAAFESVPCHVFVTESTFGLPIYRWPDAAAVAHEMNTWWAENAAAGRPSVLFAYALGKAQRLLALADPTIGPIFCHGAVQSLNQDYRDSGVGLPETRYAGDVESKEDRRRALIVAPPSAQGTPWLQRFRGASDAFASGWMLVRGTRRRRAVDRGFVLSDHADWPGLIEAIVATGAERVLVTHGASEAMARWLREQGRDARPLETRYRGELDDTTEGEEGGE